MIITCSVLNFYYRDSFLSTLVCILPLCSKFKPSPPESQSLQILPVNNDHWVAVSTVGCAASTAEGIDIIVYDSKYFSLSTDTKLLLSQLVHPDKPAFNLMIASVSKQSGSADYAVPYLTSIAFGLNPSLYVFEQSAMQQHLLNCFQEKITPFLVLRERRSSLTGTTIHVNVYCYCCCVDTGEQMVICDGQCGEWFHTKINV